MHETKMQIVDLVCLLESYRYVSLLLYLTRRADTRRTW